jgi:mono/diheme cytochrome c family protein
MSRVLSLAGLAALAAVVATPFHQRTAEAQPAAQGPAPKLEYNRDVRPILAENCFACHGPDSAARKADLRLDRREDAVASGALVPGDPAKSSVIERICSTEPRDVMPPPKTKKTLTAAQKETLRRWVADGAPYEPHWSLIAPKRPVVPVFTDAPAKQFVRTPIDAFVLAKLRAAGQEPASEADRRTLARRLAFDLTGLPPEPDDVEAFVADTAPNWYEKYVDKLMASPHWGEHRGRYWLDAARYADTHGIHFDNFREIWAYRDWVINAFNANQPFDRFTLEQLAGDLLPNPTLDQRVATGFIRCNITTNEGGIIDEEYAVLYARDRTETVNQVWMGLTAGCAVCHDHKFDPISQREFYSMSAFFNNLAVPVRDGNIPNPNPVIPVPRAEDRPRLEAITPELAAAKTKVDARKGAAKGDFATWLETAKAEDYGKQAPTAGLVFHAPLKEVAGKVIAITINGKAEQAKFGVGYDFAVAKADKVDKDKAFTIRPGDKLSFPTVGDFDRTQPFAVAFWITTEKKGINGAVLARMDEANGHRGWDVWVQNDRIGAHIINAWPGDAIKNVAKGVLAAGRWTHVTVAYDGSGTAAGLKIYYNGEPQPVDTEADGLKSTTRTTVPFTIGQRHTTGRVSGVSLEDLRIYARPFTGIDASQLAGSRRVVDLLSKDAGKRTPAETTELFNWWLVSQDRPYQQLSADYRKLQEEEVAIRGRGTIAHVAVEKATPPEAYILFRGDYDKRRDKVDAKTPAALPAFPADLPKNRLGFAQWLLRADHPLTTRVTVNRFWQELYGTGLVKTSGDFGITGDLPSHPELLDWLAVEFRETGWDVKQFFKLLVTSSAYRQAAVTTPLKREKDRDNRLLSRGPRFRMDAEMVRDAALASSGLLVRRIGGPSVRPYQPDGVWEAVAMIGSNTRDYRRDSGASLYRRSLYTFWKRSAPPASMEVLNAPNRELCTVRRDRTNTPLQALLTLNDVQFVEAARVLAERAMKTGGATPRDRLDFVARRLLARPFRDSERAVVEGVLTDLLAHYREKPGDAARLIAFGESKADATLNPAELAAYTMAVNQIMNLDEVLNK